MWGSMFLPFLQERAKVEGGERIHVHAYHFAGKKGNRPCNDRSAGRCMRRHRKGTGQTFFVSMKKGDRDVYPVLLYGSTAGCWREREKSSSKDTQNGFYPSITTISYEGALAAFTTRGRKRPSPLVSRESTESSPRSSGGNGSRRLFDLKRKLPAGKKEEEKSPTGQPPAKGGGTSMSASHYPVKISHCVS